MADIKGKKAQDEKRYAALSSVAAALGLVGFKLVVGLVTNSLGILSEAVHSGLDLVAALVTYLAVRVSDKPADEEHHYGHGKVENLSAFFETLLLLGTCVWIIIEAAERLFVKTVEVDASIWAFLVMIISIVVDISRSRMLYRAARAHNSQALEADALHFSTDIWSSSVVLLGLVGVLIGNKFPSLKFMEKADAIAALGVAVIVVWISLRLGKRTIQGLLDAAPAGLNKKIKKSVEDLPGVADCHQVRVRTAGPRLFIDVHISVDGNQTLNEAHRLTETVENTIRDLAPRADVTVHPEPAETASNSK
jgi:cation diffusion facilitator family transporter